MNTIQLRIAAEAIDSFIGYLAGYVIEVTTGSDRIADPMVVIVDGVGRNDGGFIGPGVRTYDEDALGATGEPLVIDFDDLTAITVY